MADFSNQTKNTAAFVNQGKSSISTAGFDRAKFDIAHFDDVVILFSNQSKNIADFINQTKN